MIYLFINLFLLLNSTKLCLIILLIINQASPCLYLQDSQIPKHPSFTQSKKKVHK
jgi:hypothetical protein